MHTVEAADERGIPVAAVPGSVLSAASSGTNALIAAGSYIARDAKDVLALVALVREGKRLAFARIPQYGAEYGEQSRLSLANEQIGWEAN